MTHPKDQERGVAMRLLGGYLQARTHIISAGFENDIEWAEQLSTVVAPDDRYILRETAWVIVNSGFRYAVARKLWPSISLAFCGWSVDAITEECVGNALAVFNHKGKMAAIYEVAQLVQKGGALAIVADAQDPPKLCRLPYIGKVTCWHLAKVLGVDCVKPDVHLERAANAAGAPSPLALCQAIQDDAGDTLSVIDSVLWRYGQQQKTKGWPSWAELWNGSRQ